METSGSGKEYQEISAYEMNGFFEAMNSVMEIDGTNGIGPNINSQSLEPCKRLAEFLPAYIQRFAAYRPSELDNSLYRLSPQKKHLVYRGAAHFLVQRTSPLDAPNAYEADKVGLEALERVEKLYERGEKPETEFWTKIVPKTEALVRGAVESSGYQADFSDERVETAYLLMNLGLAHIVNRAPYLAAENALDGSWIYSFRRGVAPAVIDLLEATEAREFIDTVFERFIPQAEGKAVAWNIITVALSNRKTQALKRMDQEHQAKIEALPPIQSVSKSRAALGRVLAISLN